MERVYWLQFFYVVTLFCELFMMRRCPSDFLKKKKYIDLRPIFEFSLPEVLENSFISITYIYKFSN